MKSRMVFAALLLILLLSACTPMSMTQVESAPPPEDKVIIQEELSEPKEIIHYQVEMVSGGDTKQTEDGVHLVTCTFDIPQLMAYRTDGTVITAETAQTEAEDHALDIAAAFNETFGEWTKAEEFDKLADAAAGDLMWYCEEKMEWYGGYYLDLGCTVYQTDRLISISGLYYSYAGGAHPNTWRIGWNFDLEEGTFFEPELLGDGPELTEAVTAEIIRQAGVPLEDGTIRTEWYWEDYEAIIANWNCYAVTFDEAGMTVVFSPYELAAYAFGPQEFFISYEFLESYFSDYGRAILDLKSE